MKRVNNMNNFKMLNISMNELKAIDELQRWNKPHLEGSTLDYIFKTEIYKEVREIWIRYSVDKPYARKITQVYAKDLEAVVDRSFYINNDKRIGICLYCTWSEPEKEILKLSDFIEKNVKNKTYNIFTIIKSQKEPRKLIKIAPRHYSYEVVRSKEYKDHWDIFICDPYMKKNREA